MENKASKECVSEETWLFWQVRRRLLRERPFHLQHRRLWEVVLRGHPLHRRSHANRMGHKVQQIPQPREFILTLLTQIGMFSQISRHC